MLENVAKKVKIIAVNELGRLFSVVNSCHFKLQYSATNKRTTIIAQYTALCNSRGLILISTSSFKLLLNTTYYNLNFRDVNLGT